MIRRADSFEKLAELDDLVPKTELKRCIPNTESLLKVYCRMKPCSAQLSSHNFISRIGNALMVAQNNAKKTFSFTRVFDERATNQDLFDEMVQPILESLLHKGTLPQPSQVRSGFLVRGFRRGQNLLDHRAPRQRAVSNGRQGDPETEGGARGQEYAAQKLARARDELIGVEEYPELTSHSKRAARCRHEAAIVRDLQREDLRLAE